MEKFMLPYGQEKMAVEIEKEHLAAVLVSEMADYQAPKSGAELVQEALENPIGTPRLSELVKGKKTITIISSDHTRPVPSHIIMPLLLKEIRLGNPEAEITILVATGCHRETTKEELIHKYGAEIVEHEKIVIHDCDDMDNMKHLGVLPSGGDFYINKVAVDADLLVAEGFIEPHFFAGFSGGRKSVLPGVASRSTVLYNHNSAFIDSPNARTGNLEGNPIHQDMIFAAKSAGLKFIVNVVIDSEHEPIYAVAGDLELAHKTGVDFLKEKCQVQAVLSDIAISTNGGYPLDQNIYQAVKGMTAAEATVKKGGVIIMVARSADGHGGESFYETFKNERDLNRMMEGFLARKAEETIVDQWEAQILARILLKATVIYVSSCEDALIEDMHMIPAHDVQEALKKAREIVGKEDYQVTVIPDGIAVMVR